METAEWKPTVRTAFLLASHQTGRGGAAEKVSSAEEK